MKLYNSNSLWLNQNNGSIKTHSSLNKAIKLTQLLAQSTNSSNSLWLQINILWSTSQECMQTVCMYR